MDLNFLNEASLLLPQENGGCVWRGEFVGLLSSDPRFNRKLHRITADIWNICSLAHRLEWMRYKFQEDACLQKMWSEYAVLDIEHFHTEMRSIMDHIAIIIGASAGKKSGQIPDSFDKLIGWVDQKSNRDKIGEDLALVVESAKSWFRFIRKIRDDVLHRGNYAIVMPEIKDGILFLMYDTDFNDSDFKPIIMHSKDIAYFERYAAICFSRLLIVLENTAKLIRPKLSNAIPSARGAICTGAGFAVLRTWIENLIRSGDGVK